MRETETCILCGMCYVINLLVQISLVFFVVLVIFLLELHSHHHCDYFFPGARSNHSGDDYEAQAEK